MKKALGTVLAFLVLAGCGGNKDVKVLSEGTQIRVIERFPDESRPSWVDRAEDLWADKDNYYYRGLSEGYTDLEAARRGAQASARTAMAEQIKNTIRVEFNQAIIAGKHDPQTGGSLNDAFSSAVENMDISGATPKETYSEHISKTKAGQEELYYRSYTLLILPAEEYENAKHRAFGELVNSRQISANKQAAQLSEEVKDRFWMKQDPSLNVTRVTVSANGDVNARKMTQTQAPAADPAAPAAK